MRILIFTRHRLTDEQTGAIDNPDGHPLLDFTDDAGRTLETFGDAEAVVNRWLVAVPQSESIVVYGVFPAILRAHLLTLSTRNITVPSRRVTLFEAHNVARAAEGERPTFQFVEWRRVVTRFDEGSVRRDAPRHADEAPRKVLPVRAGCP